VGKDIVPMAKINHMKFFIVLHLRSNTTGQSFLKKPPCGLMNLRYINTFLHSDGWFSGKSFSVNKTILFEPFSEASDTAVQINYCDRIIGKIFS